MIRILNRNDLTLFVKSINFVLVFVIKALDREIFCVFNFPRYLNELTNYLLKFKVKFEMVVILGSKMRVKQSHIYSPMIQEAACDKWIQIFFQGLRIVIHPK